MMIETVLGAVLVIVHLSGQKIEHLVQQYQKQINSLTSGMFISFIFLKMFHEISMLGTDIWVWTALLFGFLAYHSVSKYLYQHARTKKELHRELNELHFAGFVLDSVITGLAMAMFIETNELFYALVIFPPFFLHTVSATISFEHLHIKFRTHKVLKYLFSLGPLVGVMMADLFAEDVVMYEYVLSITTGFILYLGVRHLMPGGKKGNIELFLLGALLTTAVTVLSV
ncbi:hypothetical protein JXB01_00755 [Candidatus Micrarchaeota archaeon]|nr:hypothetical protein [Candidatus Micrarchaeota archaeon]